MEKTILALKMGILLFFLVLLSGAIKIGESKATEKPIQIAQAPVVQLSSGSSQLASFSVNCDSSILSSGQTTKCSASDFKDVYGNSVIVQDLSWQFQAQKKCSTGSTLTPISGKPLQATFTAGAPPYSVCYEVIEARSNSISALKMLTVRIPPLFPIKIDYDPRVIKNPPPGFIVQPKVKDARELAP